MKRIHRALVSVSDKTGIVELARLLHEFEVEIISTGGTARLLQDNGIPITEISDYTGFPEMMDGRLKTLHPKVHGGILGRRGEDDAAMAAQHILPIDMVVVNLYPFAQTVSEPDCSLAHAIEHIDIGGPTLLRAAAKNHEDVAVVADTALYGRVQAALKAGQGALDAQTRFELARSAFEHTARYDGAVAGYLGQIDSATRNRVQQFPETFNLQLNRKQTMRYGENPHQAAALYVEPECDFADVAHARQHQGKALSYNNIADTDAALQCVQSFERPACVIVKHANPCGVAIAESQAEAYEKAFRCDPASAFGGIIACNRHLDAQTARRIIDNQFVEVIIAPAVEDSALDILAEKSSIRVLACGEWRDSQPGGFEYKRIHGGLLVQERDQGAVARNELKIVSRRKPGDRELIDLLFAWKVVKYVKSNAIVYARDGMTLGIGAGQMSRVFSSTIATDKAREAGLTLEGAAMASDAFFPFRDGVDAAAAVGASCIIQPGGSKRDQEVIEAADYHDMAMVLTGMRHFRH